MLLRGKIACREKAEREKAERKNFTKRWVASLAFPPKGSRDLYRDARSERLYLRVTSTVKTFYWEKTFKRKQKRVNIGRFPEFNVEQARAIADEISYDYRRDIDVQQKRRANREEPTFGGLWRDYRANRKRKIDGEDSVALDYQWKSYFKKWEHKQLSEITKAKAQRMILDIRNRRKSPFHGNRIHAHGKAMFNYAIEEWEWEGTNPFRFGMAPEKGRERSGKKGARLYDHQMSRFMEGLDACSEGMRVLFLCALSTGRRMGEVQAMRWDELELESGHWFLPKTKRGIPQQAMLPDAIVEVLVQRQEKIEGPWVFPSPSKSGHVEEIKGAWKRVRQASGLHDLQARDLRRTFISMAQEAGVPIAAVQKQVGHADIATTAKHYTTFSDSAKRNAVDATYSRMIKAAK